MAQLTVQRKQGSTFNVTLNGTYPITTIRRKYQTWLVPHGNELIEVDNLDTVGKVIMNSDTKVKLVR
ncbi:MAG: hypothetical protein R3321_03370 [Nitrososphaeraceae archaeon]|nr:hypothetical protein [Nitrososphaeraceae archaeon]